MQYLNRRASLFVLLVCTAAGSLLQTVFNEADIDHDGSLSAAEFEVAVEKLGGKTTMADPPAHAQVPPPQPRLKQRMASLIEGGDDSSGFYKAFLNSLGMIWATEIGDKTFFIAAILAMRHPRIIIFLGAVGALAVMTVLSSMLGYALPSVLPRKYTHYMSAMLFLYFGFKMLRDAMSMDGGSPSEELSEVEEELNEQHHKKDSHNDEEDGVKVRKPQGSGTWKIFSQAFVLTFLAEWGDRSQIATIALAAAKDPYGVTAGGIVGHAMCTGLAVVGGRILAASISERTVALAGGSIFLVFAMYAFFVEDVVS